jgi:hypothetical protein
MLSTRRASCCCCLPPALLFTPCSSPLDLVCHHHLLPLLSAAVVVRHCRCRPPPPSLFATTFFRCHSHQCHFAASAFSCHPLSSFPVVVRRLILHDVGFHRYCCLPSALTAAAVFHRHSHHHHSAVLPVSHCPLSSFSTAVRRPILHVVVIRQHRHPLPSLSAVALLPLVLPPTLRC